MRLYGKNSVIERLRANPKSIKKIFLEYDHVDAAYFRSKAEKWGIPLVSVPRSKMIKIARNINTQGVLVEIDDFSYISFEELLENAFKQKRSILFLDGLNDPQNLGGIVRSLACLGRFSLVLPTHGSVEITETVLRVASGGDNYVSVAKVSNLGRVIQQAKEAGFLIIGAVVGEGQNLTQTQLSFPLALVVGSEQKGIREVIRKTLDLVVTISMAQSTLSLNVAHATSILCYEIVRQQIHQQSKKIF